jgi:ArsR family transcriptional regulator
MQPLAENIDPQVMEKAAGLACDLLKVLANTDRLMILCQLTQGAKSVGDIEQATQIKQPTLSQQLTVLRHAQIVSTRRQGKYIYYSILDPVAVSVMALLYEAFCAKE